MAAFGKKQAVEKGTSLADLFTPSNELSRVPGCKLGVMADAGVGKTHLACTAKKPIYFIDTENSARMIAKNFPEDEQKDIHILEVLKFIKVKGSKEKIDYGESLEAVMSAINLLDEKIHNTPEGEEGTIVIDSATDVWTWLTQWLYEQKDLKYTNSGFLMQTEYSKRNRRWADFLTTLRACSWHVVLTFKTVSIYNDKGEKTEERDGVWHKDTKFLWNNVGELRKDGKGGNNFILIKTRDGPLPNPEKDVVVNPAWVDIINLLEKRSGLKYI
ncbi:MAG: AAA family ATPase [Candidatus Babeliales bacterium]